MSEVFAFIPQQTQIQKQPSKNSKHENNSNNINNNRAGVFDSLVDNELTKTQNNSQAKSLINDQNSKTTVKNDVQADEISKAFDFSKSALPQTMLDLLASRPQNIKLASQQVIPGEIDLMPEFAVELDPELELDTNFEAVDENELEEIFNAMKEIAKELGVEIPDEDLRALAEIYIKTFTPKKSDQNLKPVIDSESDSDSEKIDASENDDDEEPEKIINTDSEIQDDQLIQFMAAVIAENKPQENDQPLENIEAQPDNILAKNSKHSDHKIFSETNLIKPEQQNTHEINSNDSEIEEPVNDFSKLLESRADEHQNQNSSENNDGSQDQQGQSKNFSLSGENNNQSRNQRNNNSRVGMPSENSRSYSANTNTTRAEHHNNFQSFFEGVLDNRKVSTAENTTPLNLRTGYNFTQSGIVRDGLVNVVRFIRADGIQKANVIIDPPALGRVSVELSSTSSGVEATIKVASEQIRQLVQSQLTQLRMNLSQQGVQVAEFSVDVQQDNAQQQNQHDAYNNNNSRRNFNLEEIEDGGSEEFRIDLQDGLLYWVA